jgi:hypothetical protein
MISENHQELNIVANHQANISRKHVEALKQTRVPNVEETTDKDSSNTIERKRRTKAAVAANKEKQALKNKERDLRSRNPK